MRTILAVVSVTSVVFTGRVARAQTDCDGGCSSGPVVSLSQVPAYTNVPRLELDAVVGDDAGVQSVTMVVQSGRLVATFPATETDGGTATGDVTSGDGGFTFTDGGSTPADGGFTSSDGGSTSGGGGVSSSDGGTSPSPIQFSAWQVLASLFEGANSITAVATDVNGLSAGSLPQMIVLDTVPPDVQVVSPASGQVFSTTQVDVNLIVSDATPATVSVTSPGGTATLTPDATGTVTTTASFPQAGSSSLQIVAIDSASNATSLSVPVFIDLDAPILTTPLAGGQQSGPLPGNALPWTVDVADAAQVTVAFSPGQATVSVPRGGGAATASMPLLEGVNLFQAAATSETGHTADLQRTFTYDTTPPVGSIEVPGANAAVRGTIELTASAHDALTGVASVELGVDSGGTAAAPAADGLYVTWFDTRTIGDGNHTAVATLTDAVGNTATLTQAFVADNTPPQVAVTSPSGGTYLGGNVNITASAQDGTTGIARIDVLVDGQRIGSCLASPCGVSYSTTAHGDGPATLSAQAIDGAGNTGLSDPIAVTIDNAVPAGFLISPADGAVVGTSLLVAVDVQDVDFAAVSCTAGAVKLGPSSSPTFSATVDLSGVLDGPLAVSCTATDLAGNAGTQTANITLKKWRLDLLPSVLLLDAAGAGIAQLDVRGPAAELLIPIAQRLKLAIAGAPLVPVLNATGAAGEALLQVDRAALIGSLRAAAAAGAFTPPATVQISLRDGPVERGHTTMKVR